jgi:hypothetical protein
VELDYLLGGHRVHGAYVFEVRSILSAVAHRDCHLARLRESHVIQSREILLQSFFQIFVPSLERIELDQHGAVCGVKVADACNGIGRKQLQEFSDAFVSVEGDLLAEVNQEGLVACALKLRTAGCGREHAGGLYRWTRVELNSVRKVLAVS